MQINTTIATELALPECKVEAALQLLADQNTIPFIARYRKEVTGNLDETALRDIASKSEYYQELESRKQHILQSIGEQGKLTPALEAEIRATTAKQYLEDLYQPYKPKRRTLASAAREQGLEPLAQLMAKHQPIAGWIAQFLPTQGLSKEECISGAQYILAEWISEDIPLKEELRGICAKSGVLSSQVQKKFAAVKTKYDDYYDFTSPLKRLKAHQILAFRRGEKEKILRTSIAFDTEAITQACQRRWVKPDYQSPAGSEGEELVRQAVDSAVKRLFLPSLELAEYTSLKEMADQDSIAIFRQNLKNILLAPYAGEKIVLALDPGYRTGVKWSLLDGSGDLCDYGVFYLSGSKKQAMQAREQIAALHRKHGFEYICVGNGTAAEETEAFCSDCIATVGLQPAPVVVSVNEAGASVYSASEVAIAEFPELDLTIRGAISIGRRFQDPLAELVKIDPKSLGIGQYQHDVNQTKLRRALTETTEECVNSFGVNLNTASASLLGYVSGISPSIADNIVRYRAEHGPFADRQALKSIPRLGAKAFEQAAGFLRIPNGSNPLDATAIHPEQYGCVAAMLDTLGVDLHTLLQQRELLQKLDIRALIGQEFGGIILGELSLADIITQLERPVRDPRQSFAPPKRNANITAIEHLREGMRLEGTVTNITHFGAFVDIGVHQDGLVHISQMADRFVREAAEVCSVGERVKATVISVDIQRKRISLSLRQQ